MQLTPDLAVLALRFVLVASIYALLFWIAITVQRGVRTRPATGGLPRRLIVVAAPANGPEPGLAIALQARTTIGRGSDNLVVVADPVVSARHAAITSRGDRWFVEDLGSTNGTYLGTQRVSTPVPVGMGMQVRLGKTVVELRK